jgi:hypothetical protein
MPPGVLDEASGAGDEAGDAQTQDDADQWANIRPLADVWRGSRSYITSVTISDWGPGAALILGLVFPHPPSSTRLVSPIVTTYAYDPTADRVGLQAAEALGAASEVLKTLIVRPTATPPAWSWLRIVKSA